MNLTIATTIHGFGGNGSNEGILSIGVLLTILFCVVIAVVKSTDWGKYCDAVRQCRREGRVSLSYSEWQVMVREGKSVADLPFKFDALIAQTAEQIDQSGEEPYAVKDRSKVYSALVFPSLFPIFGLPFSVCGIITCALQRNEIRKADEAGRVAIYRKTKLLADTDKLNKTLALHITVIIGQILLILLVKAIQSGIFNSLTT